MPNDLHCSSSLTRLGVTLALAAALGLAGCSTTPAFLKRRETAQAPAAATPVLVQTRAVAEPQVGVSPAAQKPMTVTSPAPQPPISQGVKVMPAHGVGSAPSRWCEYLKEDSAAEATIMRSPSVSGSVNDGGDASLGLAISLSSLHKANLVEEAADVKCRRYAAEMGLQKIAFLAPEGLTAGGFRAKANAILRQREAMAGLKADIRRQLAAGAINKEKATQLSVMVDQMAAEANAARSQADRRLVDEAGPAGDARRLGLDLITAESELEDLNSRMRTADAMDVSLHAGYNQSSVADGFDVTDNSFSGKVSFSMKLGALNPRRFEHERRAKEAKIASIRLEEGGALWQIAVLRHAHERAMEGLSESRRKLATATAEAERLVAALRAVPNPEFAGTMIAARIQVMKLRAETAGVEGSLAEIRANMDRLQAG